MENIDCTFCNKKIEQNIKPEEFYVLQYTSDLDDQDNIKNIVMVKNPNKGTSNLAPNYVKASVLAKINITICKGCLSKFRKPEIINSILWILGFGGALTIGIIQYLSSKDDGWVFLIVMGAAGFLVTPVVIYSAFKNISQKHFGYNSEKIGFPDKAFIKRKGEFFVKNNSELNEDFLDMDNF